MNVSALDPSELIHSITFVIFEMFSIMAVLTQRFKIIMRQKHSRICDVAQTYVLLVMHDLRRSDNPTRFAALA